MVFTQGRGFVLGASISSQIRHSVVAFRFATPRTPPLWQRDFFLVNCLVLRSLLASVRSGVVKTFRWPLDLSFYEGLLLFGFCNFLLRLRTNNRTYLRTCSAHRQQGAYQ